MSQNMGQNINQNKMRYTVQWTAEQGMIRSVTAAAGTNLLDICRENLIPVEAACNGKGICKKCAVQIIQGDVPVTEEQRTVFTEQQLEDGYRLACQVKITQNLVICTKGGQIPHGRLQEQIPWNQGMHSLKKQSASGVPADTSVSEGRYSIAVDLGSTTLAAVLMDGSGTVSAQITAVNSQRSYGADVISRMQASNEGKRKELQTCICRDLESMFSALVQKMQQPVQVSRIAIAGNTVMLHLLRGYSCEKLGKYPFEPVSLALECLDYQDLFRNVTGCSGSKVYLLPGLSAFAGADAAAGLYSSGFWHTPKDEQAFFIDLGTNAELAFGNQEGFVTASAAAGPAFEGGRLSCGMPGVSGAIAKVSYLFHRVRIQTIGRKKPRGICGTGALEAVAALLQEGLLDSSGLLAPELFKQGMLLAKREDGSGIYLTQADIREIQMAKAAIRAGIEALLQNCQDDQIQTSRIYLAGGFGYYLSADTAAKIGLFPPGWTEKIVICGNTSLKGAAAFLTDVSCEESLRQICSKNRSIRLESEPYFQDIYIRQMQFPVHTVFPV